MASNSFIYWRIVSHSHRHQMVSRSGSKLQRNSSTKCIHRKCSRLPRHHSNRPKGHTRRPIPFQAKRTIRMGAMLLTKLTAPWRRQRNAIESHWHEAYPNTVHGATWYWECCCAAVHYCYAFYGVSNRLEILCPELALPSHLTLVSQWCRTNLLFILFRTLPLSLPSPPSHLNLIFAL